MQILRPNSVWLFRIMSYSHLNVGGLRGWRLRRLCIPGIYTWFSLEFGQAGSSNCVSYWLIPWEITCPMIPEDAIKFTILIPRAVWHRFREMSKLKRLWYLSHRRPAKAQASLRIRAVSPEPSLFAHTKYGSRRRVRPKIRHLAPLDGCAFVFKEWSYGERKVP